jgi:hypothetical protein
MDQAQAFRPISDASVLFAARGGLPGTGDKMIGLGTNFAGFLSNPTDDLVIVGHGIFVDPFKTRSAWAFGEDQLANKLRMKFDTRRRRSARLTAGPPVEELVLDRTSSPPPRRPRSPSTNTGAG